MPEPRPGEQKLNFQLRVRRGEEARAISHQCAHVGYASLLCHLVALRIRRNTLPVRCILTRQTALVYLEVDGSK